MRLRQILDDLNKAVAGKDPTQVKAVDLLSTLTPDRFVRKLIEIYRQETAEDLLMALTIIVKRKERVSGADSIAFDINKDTIVMPPKEPEEPTDENEPPQKD